jgi:hypothetical protein
MNRPYLGKCRQNINKYVTLLGHSDNGWLIPWMTLVAVSFVVRDLRAESNPKTGTSIGRLD